MEWSVAFYENGELDRERSEWFAQKVSNNSYQYYDFSYSNRRVIIHKRDQYENPDHNERWRKCVHIDDEAFRDASVLDLGANWGFWGMSAKAFGAASVDLVEVEGNWEIGKYLFEYFGLTDNVQFIRSSVQDFVPTRQYDIVFVMRLLHFLNESDRGDLLMKVMDASTKAVIINPVEPYLPFELDALGVQYDLHNMDNHYLGTATIWRGL